MEAWISQLEMEWDEDHSILNKDLQWCDVTKDQNEAFIDTLFGEQLAAVLGENFPYSNSVVSAESNTSSPISLDNFDYITDVPINISSNSNNNIADDIIPPQQTQTIDQSNKSNKNTSKDSKQQQEETAAGNNARPKRKRQPSQVQDHIMAERKRRELLTQRFIALSAIVPGLKKTDKTSVLGEAIKYLQQLREKVKTLEEVAAKHTVESVVVLKKSQLIVDKEEDGGVGAVEENVSSSLDDNGTSRNNNNNTNDSLPQIEVRVSEKNLLFRIYCEKQKGILAKLFSEVEKHGMSIVNANIIPFGALALDITVLAQMEMGFDINMKEIIRSLHSTLQLQFSRN